MRKMLFLLFSIFFLLLLSACNNDEESEINEDNQVTPVRTATVKTGDFIVENTVYGQISPSKQIPVLAQQPGEITAVKVENGDQVKKDDHLVTIKTQMGTQTIKAPADGEVAHLSLREHDFHTSEDPLAFIIDLEKLNIHFTITPHMRDHFKKDQTITVFVDDEKYDATISSVDSMPNESGQYIVEAELQNDDNTILPGLVAKVVIKDIRVKDTKIIPTEAVMTESDETFVYVVNDDVAEKVTVTIQNTQSEETAVKAKLKKDDQVIVSGQLTLTDGSKVEVVKEGK